MKKTSKTVLTAAMFAAAMNIIPSRAINGTINSFAGNYDPSTEEIQDVYGPAVDYPETTVMTTQTTVPVPVYGPPISWTTTTTAVETGQTTQETTITNLTTQTTVPVYGPPIAWTTTSEEYTTEIPTTIPTPVYGPPVAWIGDINEDNRIDIFDMIELKKAYLNGRTEDSRYDLFRADINQDGKIGIADLVMLQNYLLGKTDNFNDQLPEPETTTTEPQFSHINTANTTTTNTEPVPQPEYGAPVAFD